MASMSDFRIREGAYNIPYDRYVADLDVCLEFCWDISKDLMELRKIQWDGAEILWNSGTQCWSGKNGL